MNKSEAAWFKNWIKHHLEFEDENIYRVGHNYSISVVLRDYGEITFDHDMRIDIGSEFFIVRGREHENWYISYEKLNAFKIEYFGSPLEGTEYDRRQDLNHPIKIAK